jgi:glycosyltransferase involved in cell wall biosynthesis
MLRGSSARPRTDRAARPTASAPPLRILLVEDNADLSHGHYAPLLRLIAVGFDRLGYDVTCLTSSGLHDDDLSRLPARCSVRRYRWLSRRMQHGLRAGYQVRPTNPLAVGVRHLCVRLRSLVLLAEARHASACLGDAREVGVIVLSAGLHPVHAVALAPTTSRWTLMRHAPTGARSTQGPIWSSVARSLGDRAAQARQRARVRHGGRLVVVGAYPGLAESWLARAPWLSTGTVSLPVESGLAHVAPDDARRSLGLSPYARVALFFGSVHAGKSPDTVWSAWCLGAGPDALLVAAGRDVQHSLDTWLDRHPEANRARVCVIDGDVEEDAKSLLFGAADLGICSFRSEPFGASATLADFAARGIPVCCSSGGDPADRVRRFGLGTVFDAGDPAALVAAVARVDRRPDPAGLRACQAECSEVQVARQFLQLLVGEPTGASDRLRQPRLRNGRPAELGPPRPG